VLGRASAAVLNGLARPSTPAATSDQRRPPNIPPARPVLRRSSPVPPVDPAPSSSAPRAPAPRAGKIFSHDMLLEQRQNAPRTARRSLALVPGYAHNIDT